MPGGTTLLQRTVDLALDTLNLGSVYVLCRQCNTPTVEGHLTRSKRMTVSSVPDTCNERGSELTGGQGYSYQARPFAKYFGHSVPE